MSLIESIKKNEGYVKVVYKDSLGIDTIGYGFSTVAQKIQNTKSSCFYLSGS